MEDDRALSLWFLFLAGDIHIFPGSLSRIALRFFMSVMSVSKIKFWLCSLRRVINFLIRRGRRGLRCLKKDDPSLYKGTAFLLMVIIWLALINMALPR